MFVSSGIEAARARWVHRRELRPMSRMSDRCCIRAQPGAVEASIVTRDVDRGES
nr:hypothetical protein JVH1_0157 [Rhodococcus sp. JVH1]